ncbi:DUF397 domain-containing protein [Lentzea sp. NPDC003310]|uniref:DUF397 domain-containing protein n=1 Tax=Lentzea sp. NPDC003310 TaxID=3154447 RepID=UPI0033A992C4
MSPAQESRHVPAPVPRPSRQRPRVRDSKNAGGDVLAFSSPAWRALLRSLAAR